MLAARRAASSSRTTAVHLGRSSTTSTPLVTRSSFATVVDASGGVKVAAVDTNQPTASVTFLVKGAGSRYESKDGVANVLKNFAFKSTANRSAIGTVRESELYGGVLHSTLGREHLALTAEFLKQDAPFFVDVLASFVTSAKFTRHELEEYVTPLVVSETDAAASDPATRAIDVAHALAFRSGLGKSLFAPAHGEVTVADIKAFASAAFAKSNIAVLGTGIDQGTLASLVDKAFSKAKSTPSAEAATTTSSATKYFGGETRIEGHGGPQTVFVGFGTTGKPSAELATIAAYLSPEPAVKWSFGLSPLSSVAATTAGSASATPVYLPYSDASLFGVLVQGASAAEVKEAAAKAVSAIKALAKDGLKPEELKTAINKAKFKAASAVESREGLVGVLGTKVLEGGVATLDSALAGLDAVNAAGLTKAASTLVASKPTYVVVGDSAALPYADEIGL